MADTYTIYRLCQICGGDGVIQTVDENGSPIEITCNKCDGEGSLIWGIMEEDE